MGCTSDKIIENNNELTGKDCQAAGEKIDYHDERAESSFHGQSQGRRENVFDRDWCKKISSS